MQVLTLACTHSYLYEVNLRLACTRSRLYDGGTISYALCLQRLKSQVIHYFDQSFFALLNAIYSEDHLLRKLRQQLLMNTHA